MAKQRITLTNGASAEDISAAIGEFLAQQENQDENKEDDDEDGI